MRVIYLYDTAHSANSGKVKTFFAGHSVGALPVGNNSRFIDICRVVKTNKIDVVYFSSRYILTTVLKHMFADPEMKMKKTDEAYSHYHGAAFTVGGIPFICLPELNTLYHNEYQEFLFRTYINKYLENTRITAPKLVWSVADAEKSPGVVKTYLEKFAKAELIAVDIETTLVELIPEVAQDQRLYGCVFGKQTKLKTRPFKYFTPNITMVGYCGIFKDPETGELSSETIVIPMEGRANYYFAKQMNLLEPAKVMQNGRYDNSYFMMYNMPLRNYRLDTMGLMHSWYAELPKSLEFIAGFSLTNYMYWKDESGINPHEYNAKDCHITAWACVSLLSLMPEWAINNFKENFLQTFPALQCSLEGFAVDVEEFESSRQRHIKDKEEAVAECERIYYPGFNPNSSRQVLRIMQNMGMAAAESADAKAMEAFQRLSPLHHRLLEPIIRAKKAGKLLSTYFSFPLFNNRLMYDLDPFGTDSGRYASKASSFWVGQQGQNFPESARSPYIPDEGYLLCGMDNEQSESRCTGYIAEDEKLIDAVENAPDFHKRNGSMFFGIPEDEITAEIRKLAKKVNHGANYNMGWYVLAQSMGMDNVLAAQRLLKLPRTWGVQRICEYLLDAFHKTYPKIKNSYYEQVKHDVETHHLLVGATGWTRYCFGHPAASKLALNKYVAHPPQSLSVKLVNRAFFKIWYKYQFKERKLRMKLQKHDELIWQMKPEFAHLVPEISAIMAEPIEVNGRTMIIPNKPKVGAANWSKL